MKVKELIEHLLTLDQELEVYTAKDSEGNGYSSVSFEPTVMVAANVGCSDYDLAVFNDEQDEIDDCGYDEEDLVRIVVI